MFNNEDDMTVWYRSPLRYVKRAPCSRMRTK